MHGQHPKTETNSRTPSHPRMGHVPSQAFAHGFAHLYTAPPLAKRIVSFLLLKCVQENSERALLEKFKRDWAEALCCHSATDWQSNILAQGR